jgi:assimilatory nitrate reductase catalytic subunit
LFADGQFFTASAKAQFIPIIPRLPVNRVDADYPLILNTGRLRDQWHTMTRTALAAKLNQHKPEPFVEIHPVDAERFGLLPGNLASIRSKWGHMLARVHITETQQPGQLFVPMHWSAQYASQGRMGAVVNPVTDPISKQPESKHTPVNITAYHPLWTGFILSRQELALPDAVHYWVKINGGQYYRYELAGETAASDWLEWGEKMLHAEGFDDDHWQDYQDTGNGHYRLARIAQEQLQSLVFISLGKPLPERNWLSSLFANATISPEERKSLLMGIPPLGTPDVGPIICACFNVGALTIGAAIKEYGLKTHQDVGQCLKAGTNCGSCIPEIKTLLQSN